SWCRAARKEVAPPLIACPTAENTAQPEHQKPGDHRKQDDVEILLKLAHRLPRPVTVTKAQQPRPYTVFGSNGAPVPPRQALPVPVGRARSGFVLFLGPLRFYPGSDQAQGAQSTFLRVGPGAGRDRCCSFAIRVSPRGKPPTMSAPAEWVE